MARAEELPSSEIIVDLPSQTVRVADGSWERRFEIDPFKKYRLLRGLDDISMTLEYEPDITTFESARSDLYPTTA
jgi:3-isopropylmalate dehydratase small subunit